MADYLAQLQQKAHQLEIACNNQDVITSRKAALIQANAELKNQISAALDQLQNLEDLNGVPKIAIPQKKVVEKPVAVAVAPVEPVSKKSEPEPKPKNSPQPEPKKKDKKKEKAAKPKKNNPSTDAAAKPINLSRVKLIVGQITDVKVHPTADGLYLEQMDCGEEKPRQIISGLVKHVPIEKMRNRKVIVVANLKPAKLVGIMSEGMVLCAKFGADKDTQKVELINVPDVCVPGDVITTEDFLNENWSEPDGQMNPKKKIFEKIQPDLATDGNLVAGWKGENGWKPFLVKGKEAETKGKFVSDTIKNGGIS